MKKNLLLLLLATISFTAKSIAQDFHPCGTPQVYNRMKAQNPMIAVYEAKLERDINNYIAHADLSKFAKKTSSTHSDTDWYDIPLVIHIMHDYGPEYLPDNDIYQLVAEFNKFYALQNDVSAVVPAFKPYIGKAKIRFHLATKDPLGNPTKGITHHYSYLTYGGDDQAKMDQWAPSSYLNIWFENTVGEKSSIGIIVAYTTPPASGATNPYGDGIIGSYLFWDDYLPSVTPGASGGSYDHEIGHYFNLLHTFGNTNTPGPCPCSDPGTNYPGFCNDDDGVDDTPPTDGCLGCCDLSDTVCSQNYYKMYTNFKGGDSLVNYPDTANEQNIMNYATCKLMFTKGQVERMRGALNSDVAGRNNLWDSSNLVFTGALAGLPDLAPITDFSVKNSNNSSGLNTYFTCPGTPLYFADKSWGDTITTTTLSFSNGASPATYVTAQTPAQVASGSNASGGTNVTFSQPGWVNVTVAATGNNSGITTTSFPRRVFVADSVGVPADGYFMEFNNADTAKWPTFNYYNNEFKWQYANVGYYDNTSIMYTGFDSRGFSTTGTPIGDYDDMYSMPMDLSSFSGTACNLNYFFASAARTNESYNVNDRLEIYYSIDKGKTWQQLDTLTKARLINNGSLYSAFTPTSMSQWSPMSISVPATARTKYTVFRFRYKPSLSIVSAAGSHEGTIDFRYGSYSTGNNFYMDRVYFSQWPAVVGDVHLTSMDVKVVPNPTSGDAYVVIKDADNVTAKIIVTDITGKQVYTTTSQIQGNQASIEIPHSAISVAGIYMVQTITGNQAHTQKLVVY